MIRLNRIDWKYLAQWTMDCPDWSHQYLKNDTYVLIGWYDLPSVLPWRSKVCPDWFNMPWKINPYVLIGWYDHFYPYWMEGFNSTDHGLSGCVPSLHEKWPICIDRLIQLAIRTAWKDQGLSRLVHKAMKSRPIHIDRLIWLALSVLNGRI